MLLVFSGKGCKNCPFLQWTVTNLNIGDNGLQGIKEHLICNLTRHNMISPGMEFTAKLIPNRDEKPKDCPFAQYPNTLEIVAHNE